jgi:hypothetical protein
MVWERPLKSRMHFEANLFSTSAILNLSKRSGEMNGKATLKGRENVYPLLWTKHRRKDEGR